MSLFYMVTGCCDDSTLSQMDCQLFFCPKKQSQCMTRITVGMKSKEFIRTHKMTMFKRKKIHDTSMSIVIRGIRLTTCIHPLNLCHMLSTYQAKKERSTKGIQLDDRKNKPSSEMPEHHFSHHLVALQNSLIITFWGFIPQFPLNSD